MNLVDIENKLPNGFHDADLYSINIDYEKMEATFKFDIWIGDLDKSDKELREAHRKGCLTLNNLLFFVIEPPCADHPYSEKGHLWVDSGPLESLKKRSKPKLPDNLPDDAFVHWFYVSEWNSRIYVAAMDAKFEWAE